jgi:hypothetical protein
MLRRITTRAELQELTKELGVAGDWHENDQMDVTATLHGTSFDTAGFWPEDPKRNTATEQHVILYKEGEPVAAVNIAMLFAWANGYGD